MSNRPNHLGLRRVSGGVPIYLSPPKSLYRFSPGRRVAARDRTTQAVNCSSRRQYCHVRVITWRAEDARTGRSARGRAAIVRQIDRHGILLRAVQCIHVANAAVGREEEDLVFDNRPAHGGAELMSIELGN